MTGEIRSKGPLKLQILATMFGYDVVFLATRALEELLLAYT